MTFLTRLIAASVVSGLGAVFAAVAYSEAHRAPDQP